MRRLIVLGLCIVLAAAGAPAQTATAFEVGSLVGYENHLIHLGVRISPAVPREGGGDIALAVFPDAVFSGFLLMMFDADGTYGFPLVGRVILFPRVGGSVVVGAGGGVGGVFAGWNAGIGILAPLSPTMGLRADYTYRRYLGDGDELRWASLSFGLAWIR